MHGKTIRTPSIQSVHEPARPSPVGPPRATSHEKRPSAAVFPDVHRILAVQVCVDLRAHPTAASPVLIPNAPIADTEWLRRAVLCALIGESAARRHVTVFDPIPQFVWRAAPDIPSEIWFRTEQAAQSNKFMRAETSIFDVAAPMDIHPLGPLPHRTDTVSPVVIVCETPARPPQEGRTTTCCADDDAASRPLGAIAEMERAAALPTN